MEVIAKQRIKNDVLLSVNNHRSVDVDDLYEEFSDRVPREEFDALIQQLYNDAFIYRIQRLVALTSQGQRYAEKVQETGQSRIRPSTVYEKLRRRSDEIPFMDEEGLTYMPVRIINKMHDDFRNNYIAAWEQVKRNHPGLTGFMNDVQADEAIRWPGLFDDAWRIFLGKQLATFEEDSDESGWYTRKPEIVSSIEQAIVSNFERGDMYYPAMRGSDYPVEDQETPGKISRALNTDIELNFIVKKFLESMPEGWEQQFIQGLPVGSYVSLNYVSKQLSGRLEDFIENDYMPNRGDALKRKTGFDARAFVDTGGATHRISEHLIKVLPALDFPIIMPGMTTHDKAAVLRSLMLENETYKDAPGVVIINFKRTAPLEEVQDTIAEVFEGRDFSNKNFTGVDFMGDTFTNTNFAGSVFRNATLTDAEFDGCNLNGATMEGAVLTGAIFSDCDIEGLDFKDATVDSASYRQLVRNRGNVKNLSVSEFDLSEEDATAMYRDNEPYGVENIAFNIPQREMEDVSILLEAIQRVVGGIQASLDFISKYATQATEKDIEILRAWMEVGDYSSPPDIQVGELGYVQWLKDNARILGKELGRNFNKLFAFFKEFDTPEVLEQVHKKEQQRKEVERQRAEEQKRKERINEFVNKFSGAKTIPIADIQQILRRPEGAVYKSLVNFAHANGDINHIYSEHLPELYKALNNSLKARFSVAPFYKEVSEALGENSPYFHPVRKTRYDSKQEKFVPIPPEDYNIRPMKSRTYSPDKYDFGGAFRNNQFFLLLEPMLEYYSEEIRELFAESDTHLKAYPMHWNWIRTSPYRNTRIDAESGEKESKLIWKVNEIQSDMYSEALERFGKEKGQLLRDVLQDWPITAVGHLIAHAQQEGVSEVWIPNEKDIRLHLNNNKALKWDWTYQYDEPAKVFGGVWKDTGQKIPVDKGRNESYQVSNHYVIDLEQKTLDMLEKLQDPDIVDTLLDYMSPQRLKQMREELKAYQAKREEVKRLGGVEASLRFSYRDPESLTEEQLGIMAILDNHGETIDRYSAYVEEDTGEIAIYTFSKTPGHMGYGVSSVDYLSDRPGAFMPEEREERGESRITLDDLPEEARGWLVRQILDAKFYTVGGLHFTAGQEIIESLGSIKKEAQINWNNIASVLNENKVREYINIFRSEEGWAASKAGQERDYPFGDVINYLSDDKIVVGLIVKAEVQLGYNTGDPEHVRHLKEIMSGYGYELPEPPWVLWVELYNSIWNSTLKTMQSTREKNPNLGLSDVELARDAFQAVIDNVLTDAIKGAPWYETEFLGGLRRLFMDAGYGDVTDTGFIEPSEPDVQDVMRGGDTPGGQLIGPEGEPMGPDEPRDDDPIFREPSPRDIEETRQELLDDLLDQLSAAKQAGDAERVEQLKKQMRELMASLRNKRRVFGFINYTIEPGDLVQVHTDDRVVNSILASLIEEDRSFTQKISTLKPELSGATATVLEIKYGRDGRRYYRVDFDNTVLSDVFSKFTFWLDGGEISLVRKSKRA